jgi:hypothetical protein|tara:strand:+ start:232 stop:591 length:360 start_codon:yes stop_codon:yes gene_type:complete
MQLDLREQAENDLAQWGLWAREKNLPTLKSQNLVTSRSVKLDINGCPLVIKDDYAQVLDASIARMRHLDPTYPLIARQYFSLGLSCRIIAQDSKIGKTKVSSIVGEIVSWVASDLIKAA